MRVRRGQEGTGEDQRLGVALGRSLQRLCREGLGELG